MALSVQNPDELIAAIPHLLDFKPQESIVFVPMRSDLPVARVDLPTTPRDRELVWRSIRDGLTRYAQPGAAVGIVCFTTDRQQADLVGRETFCGRRDGLIGLPRMVCSAMTSLTYSKTPNTPTVPSPNASAISRASPPVALVILTNDTASAVDVVLSTPTSGRASVRSSLLSIERDFVSMRVEPRTSLPRGQLAAADRAGDGPRSIRSIDEWLHLDGHLANQFRLHREEPVLRLERFDRLFKSRDDAADVDAEPLAVVDTGEEWSPPVGAFGGLDLLGRDAAPDEFLGDLTLSGVGVDGPRLRLRAGPGSWPRRFPRGGFRWRTCPRRCARTCLRTSTAWTSTGSSWAVGRSGSG